MSELRANAQWQRHSAAAAPQRGQGQVRSLKEQFGFLQCLDRPGDLFFHLSSAPRDIAVGDEVSFNITVSNKTNRESAIDLERLPPGTIQWEVGLEGEYRGVVERDLHSHDNRRGGGGGRSSFDRGDDGSEGIIKVVETVQPEGSGAAAATATEGSPSWAEDAPPEPPRSLDGERVSFTASSMATQGGQARRNDLVQFRVTELKGSGKKLAVDLRVTKSARQLRDDEQARGFMERGAPREHGVVARINGDYGFISGGHSGNLYFLPDAVDPSWSGHPPPPPPPAAAGATAAAADPAAAAPPPHQNLRLREGAEVEFWALEEAGRDGRGSSLRAVGVSVVPQGSGSASTNAPLQLAAVGVVLREPQGEGRDQRRPGLASFPGVQPPPGSGQTTRSKGGGGGGGGGGGAEGGRKEQPPPDAKGTLASFSRKDVKAFVTEDGVECSNGAAVPFLEAGDEIRADLFTQRSNGRVVARNVTLLRLREPRDEGIVTTVRDAYGFIRCMSREGEAFFRLKDVCFGVTVETAANAVTGGTEVRFNMVASDRGDKPRASRVEVLPKGTVWSLLPLAAGLTGTVARVARGSGAPGSLRIDNPTELPAEPPAATMFPRLVQRLQAFAAGDGAVAVNELCFPVGQLASRERRAAREFADQHGLRYADVDGALWLWREGAAPPAAVGAAGAARGGNRKADAAPSASSDTAGDGAAPASAAANGSDEATQDAEGGKAADQATGPSAPAAAATTLPFGRNDVMGREAPGIGDRVSFDVVWDRSLQRMRAANVVVVEAAPPGSGGGGGGMSQGAGGGGDSRRQHQQHQQQQQQRHGHAADDQELPGTFRGVVAVPPRRGADEGDGDSEDRLRGSIPGVLVLLPSATDATAVAAASFEAGASTDILEAPPPQNGAAAHEEGHEGSEAQAAAAAASGAAGSGAGKHAKGKRRSAGAAGGPSSSVPFYSHVTFPASEAQGANEVHRGDVVSFSIVRNRRHKMLRAKSVQVVQRAASAVPSWRATVAYVDEKESRVGLTVPRPADSPSTPAAAAAAATTDGKASGTEKPNEGEVADGAARGAAGEAEQQQQQQQQQEGGHDASCDLKASKAFFFTKDTVGPAAPVRLHDEIDFLLPDLPAGGAVVGPLRAVGPVRVHDLSLLKSTRRGFNSELRAALRMQTPGKPTGGAGVRMAKGPDGTRGFVEGWRKMGRSSAAGEAAQEGAAAPAPEEEGAGSGGGGAEVEAAAAAAAATA